MRCFFILPRFGYWRETRQLVLGKTSLDVSAYNLFSCVEFPWHLGQASYQDWAGTGLGHWVRGLGFWWGFYLIFLLTLT